MDQLNQDLLEVEQDLLKVEPNSIASLYLVIVRALILRERAKMLIRCN